MRTIIFLIQSAFILGSLGACKTTKRDSSDLNERVDMTMKRQEETLWCWAAVSQAVILYEKGHSTRQCDLATKYVGKNVDCCDQPEKCNDPYAVTSVLRDYGALRQDLYRTLDEESAHDEIKRGHPIVVYYRNRSKDAGHFAIIISVDDLDGGGHVFGMWDPTDGYKGDIPYHMVVSDDTHNLLWDSTYLTQGRTSFSLPSDERVSNASNGSNRRSNSEVVRELESILSRLDKSTSTSTSPSTQPSTSSIGEMNKELEGLLKKARSEKTPSNASATESSYGSNREMLDELNRLLQKAKSR